MIIKSLILGIVQGATEFLPVSSSAHLVITQHLLGLDWTGADAAAFDIALHLGTALAIVVAIWSDIVSIFKGLVTEDLDAEFGRGRKVFGFIILATVPAVLVALPFKDFIEQLFVSPRVAGFALIVTGIILFFTRYLDPGKITMKSNKWWEALIVGIAQSLAIIPGISRSGSTISTGLYLGWDREMAAKFSFLMFLPAILGATILEFNHFAKADFSWLALTVGFLSSFIVGYICVKWMIKLVSKAHLWMFSPYCWFVGLLVVIFV